MVLLFNERMKAHVRLFFFLKKEEKGGHLQARWDTLVLLTMTRLLGLLTLFPSNRHLSLILLFILLLLPLILSFLRLRQQLKLLRLGVSLLLYVQLEAWEEASSFDLPGRVKTSPPFPVLPLILSILLVPMCKTRDPKERRRENKGKICGSLEEPEREPGAEEGRTRTSVVQSTVAKEVQATAGEMDGKRSKVFCQKKILGDVEGEAAPGFFCLSRRKRGGIEKEEGEEEGRGRKRL